MLTKLGRRDHEPREEQALYGDHDNDNEYGKTSQPRYETMKSKILSGIIALAYLVGTYIATDADTMWKVGLFLILPLACIWFSDAMGGYTGVGMGRGAITSTTPGCLVAFGGWLLLLLPLIIAIVMSLTGSQ